MGDKSLQREMECIVCLKIFLIICFLIEIILSLLVISGSLVLMILTGGLYILIVSVPCLVISTVTLIVSILGAILIGKSMKWIKKAVFRLRRKKIYSSMVVLESLFVVLHIICIGIVVTYTVWSVIEILKLEGNKKNTTISEQIPNLFKIDKIEEESLILLSTLGLVVLLLFTWLLLRFVLVSSLAYWVRLVKKNKDIMLGMSQLDYSIKNYKDLVEETDLDVEVDSVDVDREDWEDTFTNEEPGNGSVPVQDVYACNVKAL